MPTEKRIISVANDQAGDMGPPSFTPLTDVTPVNAKQVAAAGESSGDPPTKKPRASRAKSAGPPKPKGKGKAASKAKSKDKDNIGSKGSAGSKASKDEIDDKTNAVNNATLVGPSAPAIPALPHAAPPFGDGSPLVDDANPTGKKDDMSSFFSTFGLPPNRPLGNTLNPAVLDHPSASAVVPRLPPPHEQTYRPNAAWAAPTIAYPPNNQPIGAISWSTAPPTGAWPANSGQRSYEYNFPRHARESGAPSEQESRKPLPFTGFKPYAPILQYRQQQHQQGPGGPSGSGLNDASKDAFVTPPAANTRNAVQLRYQQQYGQYPQNGQSYWKDQGQAGPSDQHGQYDQQRQLAQYPRYDWQAPNRHDQYDAHAQTSRQVPLAQYPSYGQDQQRQLVQQPRFLPPQEQMDNDSFVAMSAAFFANLKETHALKTQNRDLSEQVVELEKDLDEAREAVREAIDQTVDMQRRIAELPVVPQPQQHHSEDHQRQPEMAVDTRAASSYASLLGVVWMHILGTDPLSPRIHLIVTAAQAFQAAEKRILVLMKNHLVATQNSGRDGINSDGNGSDGSGSGSGSGDGLDQGESTITANADAQISPSSTEKLSRFDLELDHIRLVFMQTIRQIAENHGFRALFDKVCMPFIRLVARQTKYPQLEIWAQDPEGYAGTASPMIMGATAIAHADRSATGGDMGTGDANGLDVAKDAAHGTAHNTPHDAIGHEKEKEDDGDSDDTAPEPSPTLTPNMFTLGV